MVRDWTTDTTYTFTGVHGAAQTGGHRLIAYKRDLAPAGPYELQVVRLPENVVIFDGLQQKQTGPWLLDTLALSPKRELLQVWSTLGEQGPKHRSLVYALTEDGPSTLQLTYDATVSYTEYEAAVSTELWAMSFQPPYSWAWHGPFGGNDLQAGYTVNGGAVFGLLAVDANVFFSVWLGSKASDIMVFDPVGGNRKLVSFPSKIVGGACCLVTDGKDMTWLQGSDLVSEDTYATMNVMASPFATSAADLKPHVLRPAFQKDVAGGGGVIGGGYALYSEAAKGQGRRILTRLSDGYYWVIAPRPGRDWAESLYVDAEELALVEVLVGKFVAGDWTIVRRTIASLGPPRPPGSGFDP